MAITTFISVVSIFSLVLLCMNCNFGHGSSVCIPAERVALLDFKDGLIDKSNRLASWDDASNNEDCCKWEGITCDNITGHVLKLDLRNYHYDPYGNTSLSGELRPSLIALKRLRCLDLSMNIDYYSNTRWSIPEFLGSIHSLEYLNFSNVDFDGKLSDRQFGNLTQLRYLNLVGNHYITVDGSLDWISRLSSLEYLNMNRIYIGEDAPIFHILNKISSIVEIHLEGCDVLLPLSLLHLNFTSLKVLDLGRIYLSNANIPSWLFNISSLEYLDVANGGFSGYIPSAIENLKMLKYIDLSGGDDVLQTVVPISLGKLCHLQTLSLRVLNISKDLWELGGVFSGCLKTSLESLDLSLTNVQGQLPQWLWDLKQLRMLDMSGNNISGSIPASIRRLSSLQYLDLDSNQISGSIPYFPLSLQSLYVSNNQMSGNIPDLTYLQNIQYLSLSFNRFVGHLPRFPPTLQSLDLSNNQFSGTIPDLTYLQNLTFLSLSFNRFVSPFPLFPSRLQFLDLSNNQFNGSIPHLPSGLLFLVLSDNLLSEFPNSMNTTSSLEYLFLSSNNITAEVPSFLCKSQQLTFVDLSKNHLFGQLPDCWKSNSSVRYLDFSNNQHISGVIPESIGNLRELTVVALSNNRLSGQLPASLSNCKNLEIIDVANNSLSGEVPTWIGESLKDLVILKLDSNMLQGRIPPNLPGANNLCILQLSRNNLSGIIPPNFQNFDAMKNRSSICLYSLAFLGENIAVTMKGAARTYNDLDYLITMDLSNNHLSGGIPKELMSLDGLKSLSLSNNNLTGEIPTEIGNLKDLESLDLSTNNLSGRIPSSMNGLTALGFLNLSYNELSGEIPQGTQMMTFRNAYEGNPKLCGLPLDIVCGTNKSTDKDTKEVEEDDDTSTEMIWFYTSMAPGFAVGFWAVWGTLLLNKRWKEAYFYFLDSAFDGIYVFVVVKFSLY